MLAPAPGEAGRLARQRSSGPAIRQTAFTREARVMDVQILSPGGATPGAACTCHRESAWPGAGSGMTRRWSVIGLCRVLNAVFSFTQSHRIRRAIGSLRQPLGRGSAYSETEGSHTHAEANFVLTVGRFIHSYTLVTGDTFCPHADSRGRGCGTEGAGGAAASTGVSPRGGSFITQVDRVGELGDRSGQLTVAEMPALEQLEGRTLRSERDVWDVRTSPKETPVLRSSRGTERAGGGAGGSTGRGGGGERQKTTAGGENQRQRHRLAAGPPQLGLGAWLQGLGCVGPRANSPSPRPPPPSPGFASEGLRDMQGILPSGHVQPLGTGPKQTWAEPEPQRGHLRSALRSNMGSLMPPEPQVRWPCARHTSVSAALDRAPS